MLTLGHRRKLTFGRRLVEDASDEAILQLDVELEQVLVPEVSLVQGAIEPVEPELTELSLRGTREIDDVRPDPGEGLFV